VKKTYGMLLLCLVLALSGLLAACGGGDDGTTPATTQPTPAASTQPTSAAPTQQQQEPAESPYSDIPIYPGAADAFGDYADFSGSFSGETGEVEVEWHYYRVDESDAEAIIDFYNSSMPDNGWQHIMDAEIPEMEGNYAMYIKGNSTAMVMAFVDPEGGPGLILGIYKSSM
jgi:hypothetical protein